MLIYIMYLVEIQDAGTVKHVMLKKDDFKKQAQSKQATEHGLLLSYYFFYILSN